MTLKQNMFLRKTIINQSIAHFNAPDARISHEDKNKKIANATV